MLTFSATGGNRSSALGSSNRILFDMEIVRVDERFPFEVDAGKYEVLHFFLVPTEEHGHLRHSINDPRSLRERPHTFHHTDCEWVYPSSLLGNTADGMGYLIIEPEEIPDLFEEGNHLWVEVYA